jgi:hypothetical protein
VFPFPKSLRELPFPREWEWEWEKYGKKLFPQDTSYWAIRGLAEPSRLALKYSKTRFTDKTYEQGEGPEYSGEKWLSEKQKLGLGRLIFIIFRLRYFEFRFS